MSLPTGAVNLWVTSAAEAGQRRMRNARPSRWPEANHLAVVPLESLDVFLQPVGRDDAERHQVHATLERVLRQERMQLRVRLAAQNRGLARVTEDLRLQRLRDSFFPYQLHLT